MAFAPPDDRDLLKFVEETGWKLFQWVLAGTIGILGFLGTRLWTVGTWFGKTREQLNAIERSIGTLRTENNASHDKIALRLDEHGQQIAENRARLDEVGSRLAVRLPWLHGHRKEHEDDE